MSADEILAFGPFRLVAGERLLLKDGRPVKIGGRALDILIALADRAGEVISARELLDFVWPHVTVDSASLRVHLAALRKVLGDGAAGSRLIINVPGRGYSFVAPVRRSVRESGLPGVATDTTAHPGNLPAPPQLVGRDEVVATLASLLSARRFVSVVGPGGIGKTSVAVAVAHALRGEFDDAVCFADLGAITDPSDVPDALASALSGILPAAGPETLLCARLADRRFLIVLDNCEHVIKAVAPLCQRLFLAAPNAHLLTTSRETLRVEGENVHLLTPLDNPIEDRPSAAQALASPAVQLFMKKAAASGHEAELSDDDSPVVAEICHRLDGIPLAIELVASRVGTHGIRGAADLLDSGAALLLAGQRSALPRHQTLQAMLEWSFDLLSAEERKTLSRLSVFVGSFTLTAALAVVGEGWSETETIANAIASLVDKSLIWISSAGGSARCRLLDTTRAYAAAKLAESGEAKAMARRHAIHSADFLKTPDAAGLKSAASSSLSAGPIRGIGALLAPARRQGAPQMCSHRSWPGFEGPPARKPGLESLQYRDEQGVWWGDGVER